ncbi:Aspartyl/glutamyl-tRNA(Asn/Gln) amidotransferase subunit B [Roseimaritima multifibrata]|uniref:Aspartyl/glutamyl-tRNA(Asn/Gln) amidotransferase subunit B n=1 Tax=Roseimaritima multifibrata TaxID=1930274 RepID=A0A517ME08_9BACT|nr:Asp-tRNA(Asn)/Glu-tRNA(Gln) amidotransferase subunit GatB [Roseimaritima multifibrata]QDS93017.1 Aspartyl/glutamyl-tRNA(Asn/Gln) amidotransferase subunit B [Roseimaritima multifibrata]
MSERLDDGRFPHKIVIGLEVHAQLKTQTKLFCRCSAQFGAAPNTQVCPVCLGLPGALPVLNEEAISLAIVTGLALNCTIPPLTKWDRKQYFYPDLPKGYQISQFDLPICAEGYLDITDPENDEETRRIGLFRAHLEEDAGKSMHDETSGRDFTRIDLNRCGTPLLEIVSKPELRSAAEAKNYLTELRLLLRHLKVSDCEMQEGSLRVDANVNLHIDKDNQRIATPIVEVKNMNSFRAVERAIEFEAIRQYQEWEDTGITIETMGKRTFGWNDATETTFVQREKEESADYRYFPDPDLLPVQIPKEQVEAVRQAMGELPAETRERFQTQHGLAPYDADVLVNQGPAMVGFFETAAGIAKAPKRVSSWIQQDVMRTLKEQQIDLEDFPIQAETLGELLGEVQAGKLDNNRARDVFQHLLANGGTVAEATKSLGIEAVDDNELDTICDQLLAANPQVIEDVQGGKPQAIGSLIGQAKKINPNINPGQLRQTLLQKIAEA